MQGPVGTAQTEQWSWILQTVWGWVWGGLSWIVDWQVQVFRVAATGTTFWEAFGKALLLFFPAMVLVAGVWGTMVSLYTIPFRSGRGRFLAAMLMSWWDAVRMAWVYWFGLVRFLLVFVGWIWGLLRLGVGLFWRTLKNLVTSPFAMLDSSSREPGVPWIAFVLLLFWCTIEATIFTFTLRPTMSEMLSDLTGYQVNPLALVVLLWFFLFMIIGGSFACIQVLNEAIQTRAVGQIVSMVLIELAVALFEVLFLYRELIDAITPWLAQQGFQLGIFWTLALALLGWVGVRGMTWFLFGRFGTPALVAVLGRKAVDGLGAGPGARGPSVLAVGEGADAPVDARDRPGHQRLVPAKPQLQRGDRVRGALHLRPSERGRGTAAEHGDFRRGAGRRAYRAGEGVPPDPGSLGQNAHADRGGPARVVPARRPDHRLQRILPARRLAREAQQPGALAAQRRAVLRRRAGLPGCRPHFPR